MSGDGRGTARTWFRQVTVKSRFARAVAAVSDWCRKHRHWSIRDHHGGGAYTPVTLLSFNGSNGNDPDGTLIADAAGDLFGTTIGGGTYGYGAVFELVNHGGGNYTPVTLYSFTDGADGANPYAGLIADAAGDLFGTTAFGGTHGDGAVFELVNHGGGAYTPVTLLSFSGANGANPHAGLIADAAGDLFGTTFEGGTYGDGAVFELVNHGGGNYTPGTSLARQLGAGRRPAKARCLKLPIADLSSPTRFYHLSAR